MVGIFVAAPPPVTIAPSDIPAAKSVVAYIMPDVALASSTPAVVPQAATSTIEALVRSVEAKFGLADDFYDTIRCESDGWQNVQSYIVHEGGPNGRENSWGVAQINLTYHKEVTEEQALDPVWALNWAAQEFAAGHQYLFHCYNKS